MTVFDFITDNWALLILVCSIAILLNSDAHLNREMVKRISVTNIMLLVYAVSSYVETYFSMLAEFSIERSFLSAINYSLVTFIIMGLILILFPKQKWWFYAPALANAVLCFISIPTGIIFSFTEDNHFSRGPLGLFVYVVNAVYLAYFFSYLFRRRRNYGNDYVLLIFILITSTVCLIAPLFAEDSDENWFYVTIAIDILVYYVFLLQQYTKCDPLTQLLNRQSYYADCEKFENYITSVVSIDMNGLKEVNDKDGHTAGDIALKTLADCFRSSLSRGQKLYRIGGDEYVILCIGNKEEDVKSLIEAIREKVAETPYTCAIGYAMREKGSSVEKAYNMADEMLYEEKKRFYSALGKDRRKRH